MISSPHFLSEMNQKKASDDDEFDESLDPEYLSQIIKS